MTVVGILGTMYGIEGYNCTLDHYANLITEFQPDVICGEVHPSTWNTYLSDRFKRLFWGEAESIYYDWIFTYCEENKVVFSPVDWFELDVWNDFDPFIKFEGEHRVELQAELEQWFDKQKIVWNVTPIPFNSKQYDEITRQKYQWLYELNPISQNFRWICRNQIMVQRIKNTINKHQGKRILCIAGADHNYCFHDGLKEMDMEVRYPLK
ncbi:hypothetical protein GC096_32655 [Paenibacillus sp. LMG 31461]|uniref:Uncharacterized protein n=1 Tax=Paenibacillus plantarum TaxID=2654975 RepID=A0ABX1XJW7_9BACL|nr:hypothetical protein [Paenibacillus plantarum]NOU68778.1 hypothetical protein [Paenibacillus plantarum]